MATIFVLNWNMHFNAGLDIRNYLYHPLIGCDKSCWFLKRALNWSIILKPRKQS